jgi:hypothetical protein
VEVLPNNTESSGAKRYTYNTAGYLTQVETHNGSGWDTQAEMAYNGLGQRLGMDAAGVIAYYVMDGNRPLTATTGSDTTSYLYGLGVIGEETDAWSYGLTDGTNTQRQLTDALGEVTYSARYTPWGDTLDAFGTGNFAFGYFGGLMDAATGLLYVGDGQYYDPSTGRFLTRNARPNSANPYLPFDPTGALFVPLAFLSLVYGKKKRKSKWDILVIVTLLSLSAGMGVAACGGSSTPTLPPGSTLEATVVVPVGSNQAEVTVGINGTPLPPVVIETPVPPHIIVTALCEVAPTPTPPPTGTPTPTPTVSVNLSQRAQQIRDWAAELGYSTTEVLAVLLNREALNPSLEDSRWFAGDKNGKRDPAGIYREAATRWYWTWIKDAWVINKYGSATNDVDREAMAYQWMVNAMQSEDGWTKDILRSQHGTLNPGFINIASSVLHPSNSEWAKGDGMWGWANAYLYSPKGRQIMEQNHLYAWGFGDTKWYIVDADTVRRITPYKQ